MSEERVRESHREEKLIHPRILQANASTLVGLTSNTKRSNLKVATVVNRTAAVLGAPLFSSTVAASAWEKLATRRKR